MKKVSACFNKQARLLSSGDFKRVFDDVSKSSKDKWFTCLVAKNTYQQARLGLIVSRKHSKLAVQRNRIKRLARDSFRLNQHNLPNIDIIVLAKPWTKDASNEQLLKSLEKHWKRLKK